MKISHNDLLTIEEKRHIITIQSDYPEIVYAIDRRRGVMWVINRRTGAQLEIAAENVYKFTDEMMSVADLYLRMRKGGLNSWSCTETIFKITRDTTYPKRS